MVIGLQLYDGDAVTVERQQRAADALARLPGVEAVNLQFRHGPQTSHPDIETVPALALDCRHVTGAAGRPKPLTREVFDVLSDLARRRGHVRFAFINSDIVVTEEAVRSVERLDRAALVISRSDVDGWGPEHTPSDPMTAGLDMFAVATDWWAVHAPRFRHYVIGEACWDNVYAAIMMCHSDGLVLNRDALILHERHAAPWRLDTPAAHYNGMLAALDARYFSLWVDYWHRLVDARKTRASAEAEERLRRDAFTWRPSAWGALRQAGRNLRARVRFRRAQTTWLARGAN
jgi:hypothetical protein